MSSQPLPPIPVPPSGDLDQIFMTAWVAMVFAQENWPQFRARVSEKLGGNCPLTPKLLDIHTASVIRMIDPERLPK